MLSIYDLFSAAALSLAFFSRQLAEIKEQKSRRQPLALAPSEARARRRPTGLVAEPLPAPLRVTAARGAGAAQAAKTLFDWEERCHARARRACVRPLRPELRKDWP